MAHWVDLARQVLPRRIRHHLQRFIPLTSLKRSYANARDPLSSLEYWEPAGAVDLPRVGIIRNQVAYHTKFVAACQETGLPFQVIDLAAEGWLSGVRSASCDFFLVWPDAMLTDRAKMVKDRCDLIERDLGLPVFPRSSERWLYEDKTRVRDWLCAHDVPHPRTWVFFDRAEAMRFVRVCDLPLVFKTPFGAAATGVRIVRRRWQLQRLVRQAFGSGHVPAGHDRRDRQRGSVILQEYLPAIREWRLVRIGDSYFGHPKGQVGAFHSGSGAVEWAVPESRHLEFLHEVTEKGGFRSMAVDTFETPDGRLLVNELQTVFGASTSVDQLKVNGVPGRMVRDGPGDWSFEPGDFARNACANERLRDILREWQG